MKTKFIFIFSIIILIFFSCTQIVNAQTSDTEYLYITYYDTGALGVVNTGTNTYVSTAPISVKARDILSSPNGDRLYAVTGEDNKLIYIEPVTNEITTSINLPDPCGVTVTHDNKKLYVSLYDNAKVSVIDVPTGNIIKNITVGTQPGYMVLDKEGTTLYVVNENSTFISVISVSSDTVIGNMSLGSNKPYKIVLNNDNSKLYAISNNGDFAHNGTVYVFNTSNNIEETHFNTDIYPYALDIDSYGNYYIGIVPFESSQARCYLKYDESNTLINRVGVSYDPLNPYDYPVDIKIAGNGELYIAHGTTISVYNRINNTLITTIYTNKGNAERMCVIIPRTIIVSQQIVKFTVSSAFGLIKYPGVTVNVVDTNGVTIYSQQTGQDASVPFVLYPNRLYTINAVDASRNINNSITLYPTSTEYTIDIGLNPIINFNGLWHSTDINQSYTFNEGTGDPLQDITLSASQSPHTIPTSRSITATYNDDTASTNNVNFSLYKMNNNVSTFVSSQSFNLGNSGNVLVNGGFDTGDLTGWNTTVSPGDYIYVSQYSHYDGQYSGYFLTVNTNTSALISNLYSANVAPGQTWKIKLHMKGTGSPVVYIGAYDINGNWISNVAGVSSGPLTSDWVEYTYYSSPLPANTAKVGVAISTYSATNFYVDSITLSSNTAAATFNIANESQNKAASTYKIVVDADTDAYGNVERVYYASWDGTGYLLPGLGLDNKALPYAWICFGVVFLIVIIGTYLSNGIIIFIAGGAWEVMIAMGWMTGSAQNFALGALVMAIGAGYVLMQKRREMV